MSNGSMSRMNSAAASDAADEGAEKQMTKRRQSARHLRMRLCLLQHRQNWK
jgi:hypothetical protein